MSTDQQGIFDSLMNLVAPRMNQPYQGFQGQRVAPLSGLTQQGLGMVGQGARFATDAARQGMGALQGILGRDPSSLFDPVRENVANLWGRRIMPDIMSKFAGRDGASSSGAREALGRAGTDLSLGLGAQLAPMALQAQAQQLGAASAMPALAGIPGAAAGQMITAGGIPQEQQQREIQGQREVFAEQQPLNNPYLQAGQNLMGIPLRDYYLKQSSGGLGTSLLGGLASGAGAALGGMATGGIGPLMGMAGGAMGGIGGGLSSMFGGRSQPLTYSYDNPYAWPNQIPGAGLRF